MRTRAHRPKTVSSPNRASVTFPADVYSQLERVAAHRNVSISWVVRDAAEKYVKEVRGVSEENAAQELLALDLYPQNQLSDTDIRLNPACHKVAGLFAGIGGIELGLSTVGHKTELFCENDTAAAAVLKSKFPETPCHHDVTTLLELPPGTTLVTAGFPCQDLSQAGSTRGINGARSGLVEEVFRLLRRSKTPWVLLENVPFMLQLARGAAMEVITRTFEELGYKWAYRVVDSRAFGLPQRRRRVYFLASNVGDPRTVLFADETSAAPKQLDVEKVACGFYWTEGVRGLGWAVDATPTLKGGSTIGIPSPPAILMPGGRIVTPNIESAERLQGFPRNWTEAAETVSRPSSRWKLIGNAVSVPAAAWIGRRMQNPGLPKEFQLRRLDGPTNWPTAAWNVGWGRVAVTASEFPVEMKRQSLKSFIGKRSRDLSARATAGFLSRAERARLRFPKHFLPAVRAHLERMQEIASDSAIKTQRRKPRR
jgi:DNA (cytosine-5)-methyltransferase 1